MTLIIYGGVTIGAMARVTTSFATNVYYTDYSYGDATGPYLITPILFIIFSVSLFYIVTSLLCDIPLMIAHFITSKVMSHPAFRTLVSYSYRVCAALHTYLYRHN